MGSDWWRRSCHRPPTTLVSVAAAQQSAKPPATAAAGAGQPTLLGQYGDWAPTPPRPAATRSALRSPSRKLEDRAGRSQARPGLCVHLHPPEGEREERGIGDHRLSVQDRLDATAEIGTAKFAMYTQNDGAWIKNVAEEARMIDAMRKGADLTVKGTSGRGTQSTDQYSLKGLPSARARRAGVQVATRSFPSGSLPIGRAKPAIESTITGVAVWRGGSNLTLGR